MTQAGWQAWAYVGGWEGMSTLAEHVWTYGRVYTQKDLCVQGVCMCLPQLCRVLSISQTPSQCWEVARQARLT